MQLTNEEKAMLAGDFGSVRKWAIEHQIAVGDYFGARDLVTVTQAHIMADTEALGEAGVEWLEHWKAFSRQDREVRVPTITDPRGTDFASAERLKQRPWMVSRERRAVDAFTEMGILMTNTCINYQTIMPPVFGEHVAYGDTGVVIYCNSVLGARSNFEGGPSALAAGLTGRTPRYGYHLDAVRQPSLVIDVEDQPRELHEWGALGALTGRAAGGYWRVPILRGLERIPTSDELKHFGAAAASFGSLAIFHLADITPDARANENFGDLNGLEGILVCPGDLGRFRRSYYEASGGNGDVDLVVFSAPQLSLVEMEHVARLLSGRRVEIPVLVVTSSQVKADADRLGLTGRIEEAGAWVLEGMCFYNSYAREMAEANGWRRLATNSAKLTNIIGGYGYSPLLASMEECIDGACKGGRIVV